MAVQRLDHQDDSLRLTKKETENALIPSKQRAFIDSFILARIYIVIVSDLNINSVGFV